MLGIESAAYLAAIIAAGPLENRGGGGAVQRALAPVQVEIVYIVCCSVLQCVSAGPLENSGGGAVQRALSAGVDIVRVVCCIVCCIVLQCCCSVLHCAAVLLQCVALCCSVAAVCYTRAPRE